MRYNITDGMVAMSGEYGVGGCWASFETDKIKRHLQDGASVKGLAAYWRKGKKWVPKYNIEPGTILRTQQGLSAGSTIVVEPHHFVWGIPYLHSNSRTIHRGHRSRVREIGTQRGIDGREVGSPPALGW